MMLAKDSLRPSCGVAESRISESERWLQEVVYLPSTDYMPEAEWRLLVTILLQVARPTSPQIERELVTQGGVFRAS